MFSKVFHVGSYNGSVKNPFQNSIHISNVAETNRPRLEIVKSRIPHRKVNEPYITEGNSILDSWLSRTITVGQRKLSGQLSPGRLRPSRQAKSQLRCRFRAFGKKLGSRGKGSTIAFEQRAFRARKIPSLNIP